MLVHFGSPGAGAAVARGNECSSQLEAVRYWSLTVSMSAITFSGLASPGMA